MVPGCVLSIIKDVGGGQKGGGLFLRLFYACSRPSRIVTFSVVCN